MSLAMQRFEATIAVVSLGTLCPVGAAHRAVKFRRTQAGIDVHVTDPDSETRRAWALLAGASAGWSEVQPGGVSRTACDEAEIQPPLTTKYHICLDIDIYIQYVKTGGECGQGTP